MATWGGNTFRRPDGAGHLARTLLVGCMARANPPPDCCVPVVLCDLAVGCNRNGYRPRRQGQLRCDVPWSRRGGCCRARFGGRRRRRRDIDADYGAASALFARGLFLPRGGGRAGHDPRRRFTPRHGGQPRVQPDEVPASDSGCQPGRHRRHCVYARPVRRVGRDRLALPGGAPEALGCLWRAEPHHRRRARLWPGPAGEWRGCQDISGRACGQRCRLSRVPRRRRNRCQR
jgi:hypothetical protein